eukprot:CAMPEP_0181301142 /NCGR_PEP_ID=MMETSP1101-20121128/7264_1 /TAXON_ID=46948 /ORGANISM="Rhodomonas abbreviata, Strain Caron Lab Isolate" /LENGTH=469 /DNA_ID=CAMNT_0023406423 /DNA_START=215 /DNA_END=1625 /DNA_ORIENTATION=+
MTWGPKGDGDNPWYEKKPCIGCKTRLLDGSFQAADKWKAKANEMKAKLAPASDGSKAEVEEQAKRAAEANAKAEEQAKRAAEAKAKAEAEANLKAKAEAEERAAAAQEAAGELEDALPKLLRAHGLEHLVEPIGKQGFKQMQDLRDLSEKDVDELCAELGLIFKEKVNLRRVHSLTKAAESGAPVAKDADLKFAAPKLVLGSSTHAAKGIQEAVGLSTDEYARKLGQRVAAMEEEWNLAGSEEDKANFRYVRSGRAKLDLPRREAETEGRYHGGVLKSDAFDTDNQGKVLQDFVMAAPSKAAGLAEEHVLALRLYTSSSYPLFNQPMRNEIKPHPIAMTVIHLFEALKKLRSVDSQLDPKGFNKVMWLWRGMKDKTLDFEQFKEYGGTELAPMSTTKSREVALSYSSSEQPLVFKYKAKGLSRGVSIGYLSLYPGEEEFLYPPLTFLSAEEDPEQDGNATILCVSPQIP